MISPIDVEKAFDKIQHLLNKIKYRKKVHQQNKSHM